MHAAGVHRRCDQWADEAALRADREYGLILEGAGNVSGQPRLSCAFYSDKHSVFKVNKPDVKGGSGMTQSGRTLAELHLEFIRANTSQAKGRVERANRTLQDRLVKELRLENVCNMNASNTFLPEFLVRYNEHFAVQPFKPEDLHKLRQVGNEARNNGTTQLAEIARALSHWGYLRVKRSGRRFGDVCESARR
ncbi:MAG: hypothetical protein ACRYFU_26280 [Janthinobacterium lividum]